jgi:hypothetical protein
VKYIKHTLSVILLLAFFTNSIGVVLNKLNDNKTTVYEMTDKAESTNEKAASEKDNDFEKYHSAYIFSVLRFSTEVVNHQYIFALPKVTLGIFMPPPEIV